MTADDPNRSRKLSRVVSIADDGRAVEGQRQLDRVVTEQVAERDADQRDAPALDLGQGVGEQGPAGLQQRHRVRRRLGQGVRPRRSCEVVEPQAQRHRSADAVRAPQAPGEPVDQRDQVGIERLG